MIPSEKKILRDRKQLPERLSALTQPLVFTNGCFDILHRGHVSYLEQAIALGGCLVVGVNSDESIHRLSKAGDRPYNSLDDRMAVLAALSCVSLVIPFDEDTPLELIKLVQPDHLVKGGDWLPENIVGADVVEARGGKVHSIPFKYDRSTSTLIQRIRE